MLHSYWDKAMKQSISRRRALAATGGTAVGAALLAACGGGGDSGGGVKGDASGLLTAPADTSKQAKRGGIMKFVATVDVPTLDVHSSFSPVCLHKDHVYSRLLRPEPGYLKDADFAYTGDLAESYEYAPDHLSLVLKLRPGIKFHNKPPVNGRAMDVDDVLFSWQRTSTKSDFRFGFANSANPSAPITGFSAPDSRTIIIKVNKPTAFLEAIVARTTTGFLHMVPKETDTTFDMRSDMLGTGPYYLEKYTPSVGFNYKRFADYYDKERPYIDGTDVPIISEYAAGLAQFKAGNLHHFSVRAEDILTIKRDVPELALYQTPVRSASSQMTQFGWYPAGKSPFLDERVRRAYSMAQDRDLFIDVRYNVSNYEAAGIPVQTKWSPLMWHVTDGWWIDPRDTKTFGPNSQYFVHNLPEAKKLLAAAGYANGLDVGVSAPRAGAGMYGPDKEIIEAMTAEAGFRYTVNIIDYASNFIPNYRDGQGKFEGLTYKVGPGPADDPVAQLINEVHSKGGPNFYGFDVNNRGDQSGDPFIDNLLDKARSEFDVERRKALLHELQSYLGGKIYGLKFPGGASGLALAWPAVQNYQVFQGDNRREFYHWLDQSKPPFTKAS